MNFIKNNVLGLIYGVLRFDWVIIVFLGLLTLLVGFPKESNGVIRLALAPVFESRFEAKRQAILQAIEVSSSQDYQARLNGYKQLLELQPDNNTYKVNVKKYEDLIVKKRLIAEAKLKKERLIAEAKLEKERIARIKAEREAKIKHAKEVKLRALRNAELKRQKNARKVAYLKDSLRQSKWSGDLFMIKRKQTYETYFNATLRCTKTLKCSFKASPNLSENSGAWSPIEIFGSEKRTNIKPHFSSTGKVEITLSKFPTVNRLANHDTWNPNGKWVGELKGNSMLVLWHGNTFLKLKKGSY